MLLSNPPSTFIFVFCSCLPKLELQLKFFSGRDSYSARASAAPQPCSPPLPAHPSDGKCSTAPCFCHGGYVGDFESWKHNSLQLNLRRQALWLGVRISHIPFGLSLGKDHSTKKTSGLHRDRFNFHQLCHPQRSRALCETLKE